MWSHYEAMCAAMNNSGRICAQVHRNHLREESESSCRLAAADARDDRPAAIGNSDARAEAAAGARLALGAAFSIGDMASDNVQIVLLFRAGRTACHDSHNMQEEWLSSQGISLALCSAV